MSHNQTDTPRIDWVGHSLRPAPQSAFHRRYQRLKRLTSALANDITDKIN